jgi:hypothetical protein
MERTLSPEIEPGISSAVATEDNYLFDYLEKLFEKIDWNYGFERARGCASLSLCCCRSGRTRSARSRPKYFMQSSHDYIMADFE